MKRELKFISIIVVLMMLVPLYGCARQKELERMNRAQAATIVSLNDEIKRLNEELEVLSLSKEDLAATKIELEDKLQAEMAKGYYPPKTLS